MKVFKIIKPIILVFILGFFGLLINDYTFEFIVKDILYFIRPILAILFGYFLFQQEKRKENFLLSIVYFSFLTALIHCCGILIFGKISERISEIRGDFGLDNFVEIFAFYIIIFYEKKFKQSLIVSRVLKYLILFTLLLSIYLYFSRTMLIMFLLIGFSIFGYLTLTKNKLKYIFGLVVLVLLMYTFLYSIKLERNSKGYEALLYKIKIAPEEIFKTKINRENHKNLWDHWRGYEAKRAFALMNENPSSYVFGNGFGSLVNLKFKAPLDEKGMKKISRLHNGYIFVLYKTGLIGLLIYFSFLLNLMRFETNKDKNEILFSTRIIRSIGLFYLFTSLIISGIYNPTNLILFVLGGFLAIEKLEDKLQVN
ncbi:MAG: O-antigen ligase family protein [Flavobacterium sp.]|nr:O-antigen ligase family protein [Flavobacterium sp.]